VKGNGIHQPIERRRAERRLSTPSGDQGESTKARRPSDEERLLENIEWLERKKTRSAALENVLDSLIYAWQSMKLKTADQKHETKKRRAIQAFQQGARRRH
jgi:hypothetical protein